MTSEVRISLSSNYIAQIVRFIYPLIQIFFQIQMVKVNDRMQGKENSILVPSLLLKKLIFDQNTNLITEKLSVDNNITCNLIKVVFYLYCIHNKVNIYFEYLENSLNSRITIDIIQCIYLIGIILGGNSHVRKNKIRKKRVFKRKA